jgi:nucleoside-diphosphate-sugar epimerase
MMDRVLVTGAGGFIGKFVCDELHARGLTPVTFDFPFDVCDRFAVEDMLDGCSAVINLAGKLGTAETYGVEHDTAKVNILGALVVADAAAKLGVPMVHIGTGHKGQSNPYAVTKACAEDLLLDRAQVTGQPISVVRAFHAYGPGQKMCAPHGPSPVRKIIPSFVCRALSGMPIEVNGNGNQLVDLVHVADVASVLVDALELPFGVVYDAGTGSATSVLEAARIVVDLCDSASKIVFVPMRPGEPEFSRVVAGDPRCERRFPFGMYETIEYYRQKLGS